MASTSPLLRVTRRAAYRAAPRTVLPTLLAFVLLVLTVGCATTAAEPPMFDFGPHPRLRSANPELFSADAAVVEAARAKWTAQADKLLAEPLEVPKVGGNWIFYYSCPEHNRQLELKDGKHICGVCKKEYTDERTLDAYVTTLHYAVERGCQVLARAYYLTKDDRYAAEVVRMLSAYADVYPGLPRRDRWGHPSLLAVIGGKRHIQSLEEATGGIKLAEAYDLIYDWPGLDPKTRTHIEKDFFGETVACIYAYYVVYEIDNNHMTWYNAGVATIAAVLGNVPWLDQSINGPKGLRRQLEVCVSDDGLWEEGTVAYHYYALQAIIDHVEAARASGLDLTTEPAIKKLFLFPLQLAYPNGQWPAYNDGDRATVGGYRHLYRWAADQWDDPVLKAFADDGVVAALPSAVYPASGYAYLRRGAGKDAVTVAMDFGEHGGHHGHPDKLQIVLYALGQEVFLDPGRLTYRCPEYETWTRQTIAHNTVALNGKSQSPDSGTLLQQTTTTDYDLVVAESKGAYRGTTLRRALVLFGDRALVDLTQVVTPASAKGTLDWTLHGQAELVLPEGFTDRAEPLGTAAGYQHLEALRTKPVDGTLLADWQVKDRGFIRTHLLRADGMEAITGKGIGYALTDRVPFLGLRAPAGPTVFIAVQDLSGDGSAVSGLAVIEEKGTRVLNVSVDGVAWTVTMDLAAGTVTVAKP